MIYFLLLCHCLPSENNGNFQRFSKPKAAGRISEAGNPKIVSDPATNRGILQRKWPGVFLANSFRFLRISAVYNLLSQIWAPSAIPKECPTCQLAAYFEPSIWKLPTSWWEENDGETAWAAIGWGHGFGNRIVNKVLSTFNPINCHCWYMSSTSWGKLLGYIKWMDWHPPSPFGSGILLFKLSLLLPFIPGQNLTPRHRKNHQQSMA